MGWSETEVDLAGEASAFFMQPWISPGTADLGNLKTLL